MKIINLVEPYLEYVVEKNNVQQYINSLSELFDHYFSFWGDRGRPFSILNRIAVNKRMALIQNQLPDMEKKFSHAGIDTRNVGIIFFVGQQCTNGHAFRYQNQFFAWIPIEAYHAAAQADIFISHEIFHALQYERAPVLYFSSLEEKNDVLRQLITEGAATYVTQRLYAASDGEALWADYMSREDIGQWLLLREKGEKKLLQYVL